MKRVGYLYEKVFTYENLSLAITNACKNKKNRKVVKRVLNNKDKLIKFIQDNPNYVSKKKTTPRIDRSSGKTRDIIAPDIIYLIKQHAIVQIIYPYLSKSFYYHSYGSIKTKGIHKASRQLKKKLRGGGRYGVTIDVKKYYDSVNISVLKNILARKFKDQKLLDLISGVLGDKEKGIPIGNYTSQIFANVYFTPLDHYVSEQLRPCSYIRQMDDMQLLENNKRKLKKDVELIIAYIKNEMGCDIHDDKLEIKDLSKKNKCIDFCGYKHYQGGKVAIRKRIFHRLKETIYKLKRYIYLKLARRFMSYWGYVTHSNSYVILHNYVSMANMSNIRSCIRNGGKRLCKNCSM